MAELENILESVMSSPESMGKIMDIVKMLGGDEKENNVEEKTLPVSGMGDALFNADPEMISKIMKLLGEYNADNDRRIRLLGAIRPYLKNEDGYHIDRAIHIVKLSHVAKSLFENFLK